MTYEFQGYKPVIHESSFIHPQAAVTGNVIIGKDCYIENAIIDKHVRIGDNVIIRGSENLADEEQENYVIKKGIVVINKNAVIPSGTIIGFR